MRYPKHHLINQIFYHEDEVYYPWALEVVVSSSLLQKKKPEQ